MGFTEITEKQKKGLFILLAVTMPMVILFAMMAIYGVWPYGMDYYLKNDLQGQFLPFYRELIRKYTLGESLSYSWRVGLGGDFPSQMAFYLASPWNLLLFLGCKIAPGFFNDLDHQMVLMEWIVLIQGELSALSFTYYQCKKKGNLKVLYIVASCIYALSGYFVAYGYNIIWGDCIVLFPLVLLGLDWLLEEGKWRFYCLMLGFCIISNYYFSISICIFLVLWFLVKTVIQSVKGRVFIRRGLLFAGSSILSAGMAMCWILPALVHLSSVRTDSNVKEGFHTYFSWAALLGQSLLDSKISVLASDLPNIYSSLLAFLVLPLFLLIPGISRREKIGMFALLSFLLLSFNLSSLSYLWHGFHYPRNVPARQAFLYSFLVAILFVEVMLKITSLSKKRLLLGLGLSGLLMSGALFYDSKSDLLWLNVGFYLLYLILLVAFSMGKKRSLCQTLLLLVLVGELVCHVGVTKDQVVIQSGNKLFTDYDRIGLASYLQEEKIKKGERIEYKDLSEYNDGLAYGYSGISFFSSYVSKDVIEFYRKVGLLGGGNYFASRGLTPVTKSMLGVSCLMEDKAGSFFSEEANMGEELISWEGKYGMQIQLQATKYLYSLGKGFVTKKDLTLEGEDAFENLNALARQLGAGGDVFLPYPYQQEGGRISIEPENDVDLYVSFLEEEVIEAKVECGDQETILQCPSGDFSYIQALGNFKSGDRITIKTKKSQEIEKPQVKLYYFDWDVYKKVMEEMEDKKLQVTKESSTGLVGKVSCKEKGNLFLSIPYDKGWEIYVDGKKAKVDKALGAFLSVELESGDHIIELHYISVGWKSGMIFSGISLFIYLVFALYPLIKKVLAKKV